MGKIQPNTHLKEKYNSYYEDGHSEWRRIGAISKADNIIKLCTSIPHSSILEIGAGDGSILAQLSKLSFGKSYFALEISSSGVKTIQQRSIPLLKKCDLFDGYNIPYEDEAFDLVILSHVIEHVEFPRQLLYEAQRVSKHLFIEVPLEDNLRLVKNYIDDGVGHINFYSPLTLRLLAQTSGLQVLSQLSTNSPKGVYKKLFKEKWWIYYLLKTVFLNLFPSKATRLFTYNGSVLCKRDLDD